VFRLLGEIVKLSELGLLVIVRDDCFTISGLATVARIVIEPDAPPAKNVALTWPLVSVVRGREETIEVGLKLPVAVPPVTISRVITVPYDAFPPPSVAATVTVAVPWMFTVRGVMVIVRFCGTGGSGVPMVNVAELFNVRPLVVTEAVSVTNTFTAFALNKTVATPNAFVVAVVAAMEPAEALLTAKLTVAPEITLFDASLTVAFTFTDPDEATVATVAPVVTSVNVTAMLPADAPPPIIGAFALLLSIFDGEQPINSPCRTMSPTNAVNLISLIKPPNRGLLQAA
jgi:hypothetical protein